MDESKFKDYGLNINNFVFYNKVAIFDYDWTLVCPKSNGTFSKDVDDVKFLFDNIQQKFKELQQSNFSIVIVTNQSKLWKKDQIRNVLGTLNIPMYAIIAYNKDLYKPNVQLFNEQFLNGRILDKKASFFVGDALGRESDFSDSDLQFANNLGVKCTSPDLYFKKESIIEYTIPKQLFSKNQKVVIMVGFAGSGVQLLKNCKKTCSLKLFQVTNQKQVKK